MLNCSNNKLCKIIRQGMTNILCFTKTCFVNYVKTYDLIKRTSFFKRIKE